MSARSAYAAVLLLVELPEPDAEELDDEEEPEPEEPDPEEDESEDDVDEAGDFDDDDAGVLLDEEPRLSLR